MHEEIRNLLARKVDAGDVEELAAAVRDVYAKVTAADPDPVSVDGYLIDPAARFAAVRAVDGGALPHNQATAKALLVALGELEDFYDAELVRA